jgi:hypothetical protein
VLVDRLKASNCLHVQVAGQANGVIRKRQLSYLPVVRYFILNRNIVTTMTTMHIMIQKANLAMCDCVQWDERCAHTVPSCRRPVLLGSVIRVTSVNCARFGVFLPATSNLSVSL